MRRPDRAGRKCLLLADSAPQEQDILPCDSTIRLWGPNQYPPHHQEEAMRKLADSVLCLIITGAIPLGLGVGSLTVHAQEQIRISPERGPLTAVAQLKTVRKTCDQPSCPHHHAVVFVHGIYGDQDTFGTWPETLPARIGD